MLDGRFRERNMLLAEKMEPSDGGGIMAAVVRGIREKLSIPREALLQDGVLRYRPDAYQFEIEQIDSPSYPGMVSVYRTHHVQVDILDGGLPAFAGRGLPECNPFTTLETTPLGTTTNFWKWSGIEEALGDRVVKFPPKALSASCPRSTSADGGAPLGTGTRMLGPEDLPSEEALAGYLRAAGIDPTKYGVGKAKPLSSLIKEVQKGDSRLEWTESPPSLRRVVEPVFMQLRWGKLVLVEAEQRFTNGTCRKRNMLLAEKMSPEDADAADTCIRGLFEELNLPEDLSPPKDYFRFMHESYCCLAEHLESPSYPGLACVYTTHYCSVQLVGSGLSRLREIGILEEEFETPEDDKVNVWRWTDIKEARESKAKGFPAFEAFSSSDAGSPQSQEASFEPVASIPTDPAQMRVFLEIGGVNVSLWGKFVHDSLLSLMDEVEKGVSRLERDVETGKLRRVMTSSHVHFNLSSAAAGRPGAPAGPGSHFGRDEAMDLVRYRSDLECFEVEHVNVAAYPGLPCFHQTRQMHFAPRSSEHPADAPGDGDAAAAEAAPRSDGVGKEGSAGAGLARLLPSLIGRRNNCSTTSVASDYGTPLRSTRSSEVSVMPLKTYEYDECQSRLLPLYDQLRSLRSNLRFKMIAHADCTSEFSDQAVACSCMIQSIRNVNPLNATFQCCFTVFLEWLDSSAAGLPEGNLGEGVHGVLNIPEIELQNTLATSKKVQSPPQVVDPATGHVACTIRYEALVQMELDMRLFPFDAQRLVLVLGLRARRDRRRALACQSCLADAQIRLEEWRVMRTFAHSDSPDGRARIQFGVMISRRYGYYVVTVFTTLLAIATSSFAAYVLPAAEVWDRLRFGIAILFAQITFRLAQDNKLPKVAYATIFDMYAMFCQVMVLGMILGFILVSMCDQDIFGHRARHATGTLDRACGALLFCMWSLGHLAGLQRVIRQRREQRCSLLQLSSSSQGSPQAAEADALQKQLATLQAGLHYRESTLERRSVMSRRVSQAVSLDVHVWLLHDINPLTGTFECKFSVTLGWLHEGAVGLPEGAPLTAQQLSLVDVPELDVHNKVELVLEEGPRVCVACSSSGRVLSTSRFHAKLQMNLNLREFPFDSHTLPVHIIMPHEKDERRAFVHCGGQLGESAQMLDEWFVRGHTVDPDTGNGVPTASLQIHLQRRSFFYVVSVMAVLLGISSLVFTVYVIPMDSSGMDFANQGKILVPLVMTLLAFKLLTASGKLPTVASATSFDRYMIACEMMLLGTIVICTASRGFARLYGVGSVQSYRTYAAMISALLWVAFNVYFALSVWLARRSNDRQTTAALTCTRTHWSSDAPGFEEQCAQLQHVRPDAGDIQGSASSAVMLRIVMKSIHSVNPAGGTFQAELVARLEWLSPGAVGIAAGSELSSEQLGRLQQPKLMVQNAIGCSAKVLDGARVVDGATGHVTCQVQIKASVQMRLHLAQFPFDEQVLEVVVMLPDPGDRHRSLVIEHLDCADVARVGEWIVLGDVSACGRRMGISWASVGVKIKRSSRYYVLNMVSLCLWCVAGFSLYALDVSDFQNRGKILVGVLLVQIVAKLAVSSKLPRIARTTAYDRVSLNNLAMLFCVGSGAALCCALNQLEGWEESSKVCDSSVACAVFLAWVLMNAVTALQVHRSLRGSRRAMRELDANHRNAQAVDQASIGREVALMRPCVLPESPVSRQANSKHERFSSVDISKQDQRAAINVGAKVQLISDVDTSSGTVESKFHVFLDWFDTAGVHLHQQRRTNSSALPAEEQAVVPNIKVRNAIKIIMEDCSDVKVLDAATGHCSCHIQFHARLYNRFDLRSFPFDRQRLEIELALENCPDRFLVGSCCESTDRGSRLDDWKLQDVSLSVDHEWPLPRLATITMLVERRSRFYLVQVIGVLTCLTTLVFSLYLVRAKDLGKRMPDALKVVLTMTTFRFFVEHRLPKVQHWTPFDVYYVSCQALIACIIVCFVVAKLSDPLGTLECQTRQSEHRVLAWIFSAWALWLLGCGLASLLLKCLGPRGGVQRHPGAPLGPLARLRALPLAHGREPERRGSTDRLPWAARPSAGLETQVVSIAFRIWLVRNVDLVSGTFECKFRVLLEWLDADAKGLPKGKKAKLPVPDIAVTNAIQSQILDASSAPEVVDPETGHLAAQRLYKCTVRMDQEVRLFPFDWQWLAISVSLRGGGELGRPFFFQYCEVEGQLQLDEWTVHGQPAFATLDRHEAPSLEDTVMCGILIRREARYYVINIMLMLGLITSLCFSVYTVKVQLFWERAEIFLGIFPVIIVFRMSVQGKLPKGGSSTQFDCYANACTILFLVIVFEAMLASFATVAPEWVSSTCSQDDATELISTLEGWFWYLLGTVWIAWNARFAVQSWRFWRLHPLGALGSGVLARTQDSEWVAGCSAAEPDCNGLAPRFSARAASQRAQRQSIADAEQAALEPRSSLTSAPSDLSI
ncbi:unnamed protein product [Prorocentrum cordatum]|nr:unnamed protein product [Polarella glacialis]